MTLINLREININACGLVFPPKSFDFKIQATSTDKPISPNYALGNGVGTGGTANLLIRFGLRIFLLNAGHKAKEDYLRGV